MERRKIVKICPGEYQVLKPRKDKVDEESYHKYGKNKSLKAISDLFESGEFALDLSEEVVYEVSQYRKRQAERSKEYFSNRGLEKRIQN